MKLARTPAQPPKPPKRRFEVRGFVKERGQVTHMITAPDAEAAKRRYIAAYSGTDCAVLLITERVTDFDDHDNDHGEDALLPLQQSTALCNDPDFQKFAAIRTGKPGKNIGAREASTYIRLICGIDTRAALNDLPHAQDRFARLCDEFTGWLQRETSQ